jgi:lysophospholipase L1-like esterase
VVEMNKKYFYIIYVLIIIGLTAYFSVKIISGKFREFFIKEDISKMKYILLDTKYPLNETTSCPCKDIGKSNSGCLFNLHQNSQDPLLIYELIPNYEGIYDGVSICIPSTTIKINSKGFRDYEYPLIKPNNTFRIIILGDSNTMGLGVELNETYSKVLERMLNSGRQKYEILNLGVDGYDLIQKLELLKTIGLNYNPDLILLQYSGDDVVNRSLESELDEKAFNEFARKNNISINDTIDKFTIWNISYEIKQMLFDKIEKNPSELSKFISDSLGELKKTIERKKIKVLILNFQSHGTDYKALKKISEIYGFYFLDLDSIYNEFDISKLSVGYPYEGHPNSLGHEIIARKIYEKLIKDVLAKDFNH